MAELYLVFTQFLELVELLRVMKSRTSKFNSRGKGTTSKSVATWLVLVLALAIRSLVRPLFGLLFAILAHGEC